MDVFDIYLIFNFLFCLVHVHTTGCSSERHSYSLYFTHSHAQNWTQFLIKISTVYSKTNKEIKKNVKSTISLKVKRQGLKFSAQSSKNRKFTIRKKLMKQNILSIKKNKIITIKLRVVTVIYNLKLWRLADTEADTINWHFIEIGQTSLFTQH